jgi:hypothetical protein
MTSSAVRAGSGTNSASDVVVMAGSRYDRPAWLVN